MVYNSSYKDYFISNGLSSEQALADLFKFASYYDQILNHKSADDRFNKILEHINVMDSKVVFPYLMLLMDLVDTAKINQEEAIQLAHILESYLFLLKACQMSTNRLNKIVVGLCDLSKEGGNLRLRLLRLLKANFPDDRKLLESLMEVDLYHQRNHLAKLSLVILEEHRTRETINFDDAQVEHIMPQRLNAEWRLQVANADKVKEQYGSTLGNLTLTKYNQEMSNKPYSEKKEFYKDSNVSLTREVAETCITLIDLFFVSKAIPNFSGLSGKWKYILAGATTFGIIRCINYKLPGTFVSLLFQGVICVMVYFAICVATSSSFTNTIIRTIKQRKATN